MPKTKIKLNTFVVQSELLKGSEITDYVRSVAQGRVPDGCEVEVLSGHDRNRAVMYPVTEEATKQCYENDLLVNAISR